MVETLQEKIKKLKAEFLMWKNKWEELFSSTKQAVDNANETMEGIKKTIAEFEQTAKKMNKFMDSMNSCMDNEVKPLIKKIKNNRWMKFFKVIE